MAHLVIQLAALGFEDDARDIEAAATPADLRRAIENALHAIEGYQLALSRHGRALGHTSARHERCQLADLDEQLREKLATIAEAA